MTARVLWRTLAWAGVCASAVPALHMAAPAELAAPTLAGLGCACACAVLAAFGWAWRAEGTRAPVWRWSLLWGALPLAVGVGAGVGVFAPASSPPLLVLVPLGFGGYFYFWAARRAPPGFAAHLTVWARAFGVAAVWIWLPLWLGGAAGEVLRLPARSVGAAAFIGVVPLAAGTILWERVQADLATWLKAYARGLRTHPRA